MKSLAESTMHCALRSRAALETANPRFLDFFAGSGLVTEAVRHSFEVVWANDICRKKRAVYVANHGQEHFELKSVVDVHGSEVPEAAISWASFPCQDLSLAGSQAGLGGERSSLVWEWLRVYDEMPVKPKILVAENVEGLVASAGGNNYRALHLELVNRGFKVGAMLLDAADFVPQSRPRVFVIAVQADVPTSHLESKSPGRFHSRSILTAAKGLPNWIYWSLPETSSTRRKCLHDVIEWSAPTDAEQKSKHVLGLVSPRHQTRLLKELTNGFTVAPGYRRTRNGRQVLELRFDGVAGCLRTPKGGSSRQVLVLKKDGVLATRLLTPRELARLMGAPDTYRLPGNYNEAYKAMGDAVAVPVVRHLAEHLLSPLYRATQIDAHDKTRDPKRSC